MADGFDPIFACDDGDRLGHGPGAIHAAGGKLIGSRSLGIANQGASLSLSGDGSTAIVGGPGDNADGGAAWIYVRKPSGLRGPGVAPRPKFALEQNYPNPFNPVTTIRFEIPSYSRVRLSVYNTLGEKVADLADGPINAGAHSVTFDASNISSGMYICALQAGNYVAATNLLK